jgi:predicted NUDIX family NTP pyrophosphohydrolase
MPARTSAGLLLCRPGPQFLLAHMGGPFWAKRDEGAWTIPKGELDDGEGALAAARREFAEELGVPLPDGAEFVPLGDIRQRGGKLVSAWAVEADVDVSQVAGNTFEIEWPPRSGRRQEFPEIDRAQWFDVDEARRLIVAAQAEFLDRYLALGRSLG